MDHASRSTPENIHAGMSIPVAGVEGVGVPKAGSLHPGAHHTVGSKWAEVSMVKHWGEGKVSFAAA